MSHERVVESLPGGRVLLKLGDVESVALVDHWPTYGELHELIWKQLEEAVEKGHKGEIDISVGYYYSAVDDCHKYDVKWKPRSA